MSRIQVDEILPPSGVGGAREGSGRKSKRVETLASDLTKEEADYVDYAVARAKKENHHANLAELEYKVKSGQYVARDAVQQASASAYAAIAQSLRSIPDNIERRLAVPPNVVQDVGMLIDEALGALADELERMGNDGF